jgi:hypothetical protein
VGVIVTTLTQARRAAVTHGVLRRICSALLFSAAFVLLARNAAAEDCSISSAQPTVPRRIPVLREAQQLSYASKFSDARALYLWLLARDARDIEAREGLARVDAWSGCWSLSEREYRGALLEHPEDSDVRGGLIDLYMWQKRWADAKVLIDEGLAMEPNSPTLRLRRAKLLHWSSDDSEARDVIRDLERGDGKDDPEVKALDDDVFVGEASVGARLDVYPGGYPNIYTLDADLLERWRKFDFTLSSHLVDWTGGDLTSPIVDGERSLRVGYHPKVGVTVALSAGFGNPGVVLPASSFGAEVAVPIYGKFAAIVDYDYWYFSGGTSVHILNPSVAYEATDNLEIAAHLWLVHVGVSTTDIGEFADTIGAHVSYKFMPRLRGALYYTYGVQLDRDPTATELFSLRSHVITAAADYQITHDYGVRGSLGVEIRSQDNVDTIVIPSIGAGFYVHW